MDVLDDLLTRARAEGALVAHSLVHGDWGLRFSGDEALSVHAVLAGELWCEPDGRPAVQVRAGQLLLLRSTPPYRLTARRGGPARTLVDVLAEHPGPAGVLVLPGEGPPTEVLCGAYAFSGSLCDELLAAVPECSVVDADDGLHAALAMFRAELRDEGPGRQVVLDRTLDVLLVRCLRALWRDPAQAAALPALAQADPVVAAALRALHGRPAHPWTVAELAATCRVSRAALARRFTAAMGLPPLAYLTRWRMQLAQEALRDPRVTLRGVAREVGYGDAYAFATAFKREVGTSPGRWRAG